MALGFVGEIGDSQIFPTPLLFNNTITIQIASNSFFYEHIDHNDVDWHSIREMLGGHVISLPHISKKKSNKWCLYQSSISHPHQFMVDKLMFIDRPTSIWGECQRVVQKYFIS